MVGLRVTARGTNTGPIMGAPATGRPVSFSGMELDYWQEFYLLGEAGPLAERIRAKIAALGGVDEVILNPLDWDLGGLERLATEVLPLLDGA